MKSVKKCPLFSTICSAADGDETAIEKILNHYDAYISKASLRPFYDEHGNMYIVVDMELKGRIRAVSYTHLVGPLFSKKYCPGSDGNFRGMSFDFTRNTNSIKCCI